MSVLAESTLAKLVALCPLNKFRRIDDAPNLPKNGPFKVVLATSPAISDLYIAKEPVTLGLIKLYYLTSLNIPCGFLFEMPRLKLRVNSNYIKIYRRESIAKDQFKNVDVSFANKHFSIFTARDMASLVVLNSNNYIKLAEK